MKAATLRKELKNYIETMPEHNLHVLKPLLKQLAEPLYIVETDLTAEEIAMIDERMKDYKTKPKSWVTLKEIK